MSEKQGPFDAAIKSLRTNIDLVVLHDFFTEPENIISYRAAIRVLEAAGKTDRNKALSRIGEVYDYQIALGVVRDEVWGQVRALIDALPEKDGK
jgi:hypothetical protein